MKKLRSNKVNGILIILAFVFNILIFAPIEIYFTNKDEFWFQASEIIPISIAIGLMCFVVFLLIAKLLKGNIRKGFLRIIFALTTALYIQGNYLNFGYEKLDGSKIDWNKMIGKGFINVAIWLIILFFPYFFRKLKKEKNLKLFTSLISLLIVLVETITLGTLVITNKSKDKSSQMALTNKEIFNYSKNENIIVIMSDTFEGTYMNEILEKRPEYKEKLKDFTYFDNCTGVSFYTYSSMPTLLTGEESKVGNTLRENVDLCFNNTNMYQVLKDNGYTSEVYTEVALKPNDNKISNLKEFNQKYSLKTKIGLYEKLNKYVLYRYMPHFLKSNFVITSDDFSKVRNMDTKVAYTDKSYYLDDVEFNKNLVKSGLTSNQNNTFKFYHMNGMHVPYNTTEEVEYNFSKEYLEKDDYQKRITEGIASLNILINLANKLKEAGIYDNTNIIFLADHGYQNRFYTNLIVKQAGSSHEFEINSAPVTLLEDLRPTILNMATNSKNYGKDFFDYSEEEKRTRTVQDFTYKTSSIFDDYKMFSKLTFATDEKAENKESFYLIDQEFEGADKELTTKYKFGQKVNIDTVKKSECIKTEGILLERINYSASVGCNFGKNAYITINKEDANNDINAEFHFTRIINDSQSIIIKIDGEEIYKGTLLKNNSNVSYTIPKEIWNKNELITIELEFPDAKLGSTERTMMSAACLNSIQFSN